MAEPAPPDLAEQAALMIRMLQVTGVDDVVLDGATEKKISEGFSACCACVDPPACRAFLAGTTNAAPPPDFCANRALFRSILDGRV